MVARETPGGRLVRWKGAGCIPAGGVGCWSATTPLVLLELDRRGLTVRMRPPPRRSSFYFYTRHRGIVLNALTEAGFTVSSEPGREHPAWYQPDDG